jgi:hypothetical protein
MVDASPWSHFAESRWRRWRPALIFLALLTLFGGYAIQRELRVHAASVPSYSVSADGMTITLYPDIACSARITSVRVDEGTSAVRVHVRAKGGDQQCGRLVEVHLRAALGSRAVIDASTGKAVKRLARQ